MATQVSTLEWFTSRKISAVYLQSTYMALHDRERTRHQLQRSSKIAGVFSRAAFGKQPKRKSLKGKLLMQNTSEDEGTAAQGFYDSKAASTPETQPCNRYMDIQPYDRNRVLVGSEDGRSGRYLNASWVRETEGTAWWIAAQAPLFNTTHAFLSLFTSLQPQVLRLRTIVQLTPLSENGVRKADQYIPESTRSPPLVFYPEMDESGLPAIEVALKDSKTIADAGCTIRTIILKLVPVNPQQSVETFEIKHLDYEGWPDHDVPEEPEQLVLVAEHASALNTPFSAGLDAPPILCHCSAGVGRTGTFIALSSLLRSLGILPAVDISRSFPLQYMYPGPRSSPLGPLPAQLQDDPVAREVDTLREQRTTMVQRSEQFAILYEVMVNTIEHGMHRRQESR